MLVLAPLDRNIQARHLTWSGGGDPGLTMSASTGRKSAGSWNVLGDDLSPADIHVGLRMSDNDAGQPMSAQAQGMSATWAHMPGNLGLSLLGLIPGSGPSSADIDPTGGQPPDNARACRNVPGACRNVQVP